MSFKDESLVIFDISGLSPSDPYFNLARQLSPQSSPSSPPSSAKKKKWRTGLPRDSLNNRYKMGKPGSKRYNRWEGEYRLRKFLSDTESSLSESDPDFDKGFDETYEPSFGAFAGYFLDDDFRETINPFLDTTLEEEKLMLSEMCSSESEDDYSFEEDSDFNPLISFASLKLRNRRLLRKHGGSDFMLELDSQLFAFARESFTSRNIVNFSFPNPYQRQMIHAISEFYGLTSFSKDNQDGGRDTVVFKKADYDVGALPESSSLSSFLLSSDAENHDFYRQEYEEVDVFFM